MNYTLKRRGPENLRGLDIPIFLVSLFGTPLSIVCVPHVAQEYGAAGALPIIYLGGLLITVLLLLCQTHKKLKFHDRAYPVLWRRIRHFFYYTKRHTLENIVPNRLKSSLSILYMLMLIAVAAVPIAVVSSIYSVFYLFS